MAFAATATAHTAEADEHGVISIIPSTPDSCQFTVEIRHATYATGNIALILDRGGIVPDAQVDDQQFVGTPETEGEGFRVTSAPFEVGGPSLEYYVRVAFNATDGGLDVEHDIFSDNFSLPGCGQEDEEDGDEGDEGDGSNGGDNPPCAANVHAEALADGSIQLTWDSVADLDRYIVARGDDGGSIGFLADTTATSFLDTETDAGVTYRYVVIAERDGETSEGCGTVEVTAIPFFTAPILGALALAGSLGAYAWLRRK